LNGYDVATSDIVANNLTVVMTRRLSSLWLHSFLAACFRFISSFAKLDFSSLFFFELKDFSFLELFNFEAKLFICDTLIL
jgi:hypothetical protein